jgi:hypothetical protein
MPMNENYRNWIQRICELRPKQRITQVQNFAWLVVGIYHSHSVNLGRVAGKVIGAAKNVKTVQETGIHREIRLFCETPESSRMD